MAIVPFLAMTAAEMGNVSAFPPKIAWMACHFSPYGLGLSNLPGELPPQSLILLDDITPMRKHDPKVITNQLLERIEELACSGVLLDFQRENCPEMEALVHRLTQALPCPVIVSDRYARDLCCPVFLPPVPPSVPLEEHISPWEGREIWLEIGLTGELLTLTEQGCNASPLPYPDDNREGFAEESLHCHYTIETNEKSARFTLWRTTDDLIDLLSEAERLGIHGAVGLYQELRNFPQCGQP